MSASQTYQQHMSWDVLCRFLYLSYTAHIYWLCGSSDILVLITKPYLL